MNYRLFAFCVCFLTVTKGANISSEKTRECTESDCPEELKGKQFCQIWVMKENDRIVEAKKSGEDLTDPCAKTDYSFTIVKHNGNETIGSNTKCEKLRWDIAAIDIALMFFLPLAACFFPYYSQLRCLSFLNVHAYVTWINCLGAGILLGTSFFHLLPEIGYELDSMLKEQHKQEKRLEIMREQNAAKSRERRHAHSHDHGHSHGPGGHDDLTFEIYVVAGFFIILIIEQLVLTYFSKYFESLGVEHACQAGTELKINEKDSLVSEKGGNHGHGHSHNMDPSDASTSTIRAIAFVASLAVHCVVEGAALTVRTGSWQENTAMLASIVFHKIPVGMTMGFLMESSNLRTKTAMIALFTWALFSPIGGIMGIGGCKMGWVDSEWIPKLSAIGLGSFIYVLFFEVTPHEFLFKSKQNKFFKSVVMAVGCGLSYLITTAFPCAHGHTHG